MILNAGKLFLAGLFRVIQCVLGAYMFGTLFAVLMIWAGAPDGIFGIMWIWICPIIGALACLIPSYWGETEKELWHWLWPEWAKRRFGKWPNR